MRTGALVLLSLVVLGACAFPASAFVYTGEVHTTVTVIDGEFWSGIGINDNEVLEYTVSVVSGASVNVYLIDDSDLTSALAGGQVVQHKSDENTRSSSRTYNTAGKYALVITNSPYTSVCKVDITVKPADLWGATAVCIAGVLVVIIIIAVVAFVVVRRRRRPAPPVYPAQPAQYGPPAQTYTPPPVYPSVQNQIPMPAYQQPAAPSPSTAQYQPAPQQVYQPPPAPPSYGQGTQQYPGQAPQAPSGPPSPPPASASTVQCKYCMMEVPAGIAVCPRCGGFM